MIFSRISVFTHSYNNNKTGEIEAMNGFVQWRLDFLNIDIRAQTVSNRSCLIFGNNNSKYFRKKYQR